MENLLPAHAGKLILPHSAKQEKEKKKDNSP